MQQRLVVLTGASRGLGQRIAVDQARQGAHVVLAARSAPPLAVVAAEVEAAGGSATVVPCDVTLADDRARLVQIAEGIAPIDVLINNAGIEVPISVVDHTSDEVDREVQVNLLAPIHLTKRVLPAMIARGSGTIVMVSSMSGKSPTPFNAVYSATKFGLNGFTASLRIELWDTGVHVGVVCPSFVADAGMWSDTGVEAPKLLKEVAPERVAAGVRRVIAGAQEVLVTPTPVRPLLALSQIFPALDGFFLKQMGVLDTLKDRAKVLSERGES